MPRFAILFHETPPGYIRQNHYDLLFEDGDTLRTWAVAELPCDRPEQEAERLPDHRRLYLEYEGPIAGERGSVTRVDAGIYAVVEDSPAKWAVQLIGARHRGRLEVTDDNISPTRQRVNYSCIADTD